MVANEIWLAYAVSLISLVLIKRIAHCDISKFIGEHVPLSKMSQFVVLCRCLVVAVVVIVGVVVFSTFFFFGAFEVSTYYISKQHLKHASGTQSIR